MRAYRDEAPEPATADRRGIVVIAFVVGAVVVAMLLYFGLRDTAEPEPPALTLPVVRNVEADAPAALSTTEVAPPVVQENAQNAGDFPERQLGPPRTAVGAADTPLASEGDDEPALVIDGELLEELEAEAEAAAPTP